MMGWRNRVKNPYRTLKTYCVRIYIIHVVTQALSTPSTWVLLFPRFSSTATHAPTVLKMATPKQIILRETTQRRRETYSDNRKTDTKKSYTDRKQSYTVTLPNPTQHPTLSHQGGETNIFFIMVVFYWETTVSCYIIPCTPKRFEQTNQ